MMSIDNIDDLFNSAADDGLTDDTMDLVIANLNGPTMTGAVGVGLDKLAATEITLAMNIIDRSGSMAPHAVDLISAYNDDYLTLWRDRVGVKRMRVQLFDDLHANSKGFIQSLAEWIDLDPSYYLKFRSSKSANKYP